MTSTITIRGPADKRQAEDWVMRAPEGSTVTFRRPDEKPKTRPQENKFHAMLRDIAAQVKRNGQAYKVEEWKKLFCDALRRESMIVPSLDGTGFVDLGWASTSKLTERQYAEMILMAQAYGDENKVRFKGDVGLDIDRPLNLPASSVKRDADAIRAEVVRNVNKE